MLNKLQESYRTIKTNAKPYIRHLHNQPIDKPIPLRQYPHIIGNILTLQNKYTTNIAIDHIPAVGGFKTLIEGVVGYRATSEKLSPLGKAQMVISGTTASLGYYLIGKQTYEGFNEDVLLTGPAISTLLFVSGMFYRASHLEQLKAFEEHHKDTPDAEMTTALDDASIMDKKKLELSNKLEKK